MVLGLGLRVCYLERVLMHGPLGCIGYIRGIKGPCNFLRHFRLQESGFRVFVAV